jgi:hypothetical protein
LQKQAVPVPAHAYQARKIELSRIAEICRMMLRLMPEKVPFPPVCPIGITDVAKIAQA